MFIIGYKVRRHICHEDQTATLQPPTWFVKASAIWGECLILTPTPAPLGSLDFHPRWRSLLQTKMAVILLASYADVLRGSSRVPAHDEPLRTSAWEATIPSKPRGGGGGYLG